MTIEERKDAILEKIGEMKANGEEYIALITELSEVYEDAE